MMQKRYRVLKLSPETLSRCWRTGLRIRDWVCPENPQWFWLVYARGGNLYVEKWDTIESRIRQDDHLIFEADHKFHPIASWKFPAVKGELRVFSNNKAVFYSDIIEEFLRDTGATKAYEDIPSVYNGLEIHNNGGENIVHADVYAKRKSSKSFEQIKRQTSGFGRYQLPIPQDTEVLVVNYRNTGRGTDSITCHYNSFIKLMQLQKEIKKLVESFDK